MMIVSVLVAVVTTLGPIALVVWAVRQRHGARPVDGRSVRRFFQYVLLYGLTLVVATGAADLGGMLLDRDPSMVGDDSAALARALTFTLFGLPMLALVGAWTRRSHHRDADEASSLGWAAYLTGTALTSLALAMTGLHEAASEAFAAGGLAGAAVAQALVWTGVWWYHWRLAHGSLEQGRLDVLLFLGSLLGLVVSVVGLVLLLSAAGEALVVREALVVTTRSAFAEAGATLVVGAPVWVLHWVRGLARTGRTVARLAYLLPLGVGGSTVLAVVGTSTAAVQLLVWFLGEPSTDRAAQHLAGLPTALACVVVGLLSWWYHRQVLGPARDARTEVTRVYDYLMAGVALLAAAAGVATIVVAAIEAIAPPAAFQVGSPVVNTLIAGVTLLAVGGPLWWVYWSAVARAARTDPVAELGAPTRRVYLFVLFGVGGVAAVVSVLVAAFIGIQGALDAGFDLEVLRDMRVPLALLVAAGAVSGYHWTVHREDRAHLPAEAPARGARYVLLIGAAEPDLSREVARRTGSRVELWQRLDPPAGPWPLDDVVAAVEASSATRLAVVAGSDGLDVIPLAPQ